MTARLHKMSLVAAKEGPDCAQWMFNPAPTYGELEEGSEAVGEISQGERSQQDEGSGRFILCI